MKKIYVFLSFVILIIFGLVLLISNNSSKNNNGDLTKLKLAEVTHSIFYAPLYVAIENGYFEDEGLDVELILTSGADKVAAAVLSNTVDIGFAGPESAIYVYANGEDDYLVTFAGLTKRDGQFIVSREKIDNFNIESLYGKEILVGRKAGMPMLNFVNGVQNVDGDLTKMIVNTSVDFASLSGAFIGGVGDFVNLFEPNALMLEKEDLGYVVGSVGEISGEVPYTAFYARKSYLENNNDIIRKFNKAINRGLEFVMKHSNYDVAKVISEQFPDNSISDIETIVRRYRDSDSWLTDTSITEKSFTNLEDMLLENDLIKEYVPFNELVINLNE